MTFPTWPEWLHSGKTLLAALLALYIALAIPLANPYWAMATVYIVANPLSGATRSKAIFRALGTLLGAVAAVTLLPIFAHQPIMLSISVGLWVALLLFLSLLDRSPRAYLFMLSAYTMPLIALSQVDTPDHIFATALARSEEILLGIACASLINLVIFPKRIGPVMAVKMDLLLKDARAWSHRLLTGDLDPEKGKTALQKLLGDVLLLDGLIVQMGYDATHHRATDYAQDFRARMALLAPQLMALAAPLHQLKIELNTLPAPLQEFLSALDQWLQGAPDALDAQALRERSRHIEPWLTEQHPAQSLLITSSLSQCRRVVDLWQDALAIRQSFADGHPAKELSLRYRVYRWVGRPKHYDYGLLAFNSISVGLSVLVLAIIWYFSGWQHGYSAVFLAAVVGCFFAAQDNPAPFIRDFLFWSGVSCVVAGIYLFLLIPNVQDFAALAILLSIPLIWLGCLGARPQFAPTVMALAVQSLSTIMVRQSYQADFAVYLDICISTMSGLSFALIWAHITRPLGLERAAKRLAISSWKDLERLTRVHHQEDPDTVAARMIDRTSQLLPRLRMVRDANVALTDASRDLRICFLLQSLRTEQVPEAINPVLRELNAHYQACVQKRRPLPYPSTLAEQLSQLLTQPFTPNTRHVLLGLSLAVAPATGVQAV